jgi:hypothetical protein
MDPKKKTPKWRQAVLHRARHSFCVLTDLVEKARLDSAPILVKIDSRYYKLTNLKIDFKEDQKLQLEVSFESDSKEHSMTRFVPMGCDCILETRINKSRLIADKLKRRQSDASEYRMYFASGNTKIPPFEFYLDPQCSPRLHAIAHGASDLLEFVLDEEEEVAEKEVIARRTKQKSSFSDDKESEEKSEDSAEFIESLISRPRSSEILLVAAQ